MQFLGMFRHVRTSHAQGLTKEMFVSLGQSAVSARDVYAEGGLIVLAEGEIRNKQKLIERLRLNTDVSMSLITARAYRMWGADYVRRMEGEVVTAVIDRTEDRMIVSSGRAGSIGVYYAWRGRSAAFASHPSLLLKMGAAGRRIEREGISELFAFGGAFSPGRTAFKDIRVLESGCVLIADSRGMRVKRYDSIIRSGVKADRATFTLEDYIKTLNGRVMALFLSSGYSRDMAKSLMDHTGCVFLRAWMEDKEDLCEKPVETVAPNPEACISYLEEAVSAAGFPGGGIGDIRNLFLFKTAFCHHRYALLGGAGALLRGGMQEGNLMRFLRKEVSGKIDAEGYVRDRFNDLIDRMHIPLSAPGGEERAERLICALTSAAWYLSRLRMLAGAAGGMRLSPLMDERFLAHVLLSETEKETAHPTKTFVSKECADIICMKAFELIENDDQPILALIDPKTVRAEIESEYADVNALSKLIQMNVFLYESDAEASVN